MNKSYRWVALALGLALGVMWGCEESHDHAHHDHEHSDGHHHAAPHGGTLVALGDHVAHLELKLEAETGELTAWVLDGEAEQPIRLAAESITLQMRTADGKPVDHVIDLAAMERPLTGEKPGDSATFGVTDEELKSLESFEGVIRSIDIRGAVFTDVVFHYPQGNEK